MYIKAQDLNAVKRKVETPGRDLYKIPQKKKLQDKYLEGQGRGLTQPEG